jgi:hypothetical protein
MGKYGKDLDMMSETGNWNSAKFYATILSSHIANIVLSRKICYFGAIDLVEELSLTDSDKVRARLSSLFRWIKTEQDLINDSLFAISSNKFDKAKLLQYRESLKILEKTYPIVKKNTPIRNRMGSTVVLEIDEVQYNKFLKALDTLHEKILEPLNRNDLIFLGAEEYDVFERKQDAIRQVSEMG